MEIIIHSSVKKFDLNYKKAIDEYIKRTLPFSRVTIKYYKNILSISYKKGSFVFGLQHGKNTISSPDLANKIQELNLNGYSCIEFVWLDASVDINNFENILSISSFQMSQELDMVVLTEQLYRAYTILNNITYHK